MSHVHMMVTCHMVVLTEKGIARLPEGVARIPVTVEFHYTVDDPWAVTMVFHTDTADVTWRFARDMVVLTFPGCCGVGYGDVHIVEPDIPYVDGDVVVVSLKSPNGVANAVFGRADVDRFIDATIDLVPLGSETIDFDTEMKRLACGDAL